MKGKAKGHDVCYRAIGGGNQTPDSAGGGAGLFGSTLLGTAAVAGGAFLFQKALGGNIFKDFAGSFGGGKTDGLGVLRLLGYKGREDFLNRAPRHSAGGGGHTVNVTNNSYGGVHNAADLERLREDFTEAVKAGLKVVHTGF